MEINFRNYRNYAVIKKYIIMNKLWKLRLFVSPSAL